METARENCGMTDWSPRGDPILALLPAERPWAFDLLPFEEQEWRGRAFLIFYTISGRRTAYAWWQALRDDDGATEAFIRERVTDDEIVTGLRGLQADV